MKILKRITAVNILLILLLGTLLRIFRNELIIHGIRFFDLVLFFLIASLALLAIVNFLVGLIYFALKKEHDKNWLILALLGGVMSFILAFFSFAYFIAPLLE